MEFIQAILALIALVLIILAPIFVIGLVLFGISVLWGYISAKRDYK